MTISRIEYSARFGIDRITSDGRRTDTIVLACTHYPLLLDRLVLLAPWPVDWVDPAHAIARRVMDLVGPAAANAATGTASAVFTSGVTPPPALAAALARFGIGEAAVRQGQSLPI